jgi:molecular chaperone GrpE
VAEQNNPEENDGAVAPLQTESAVEQGGSAEGAAPDVASLQAELERVSQQLAEAKDQALRVAAEAQNQRRRAEKDVENAHKFALEKFVAALLPVADNLERTMDAADRDNEAVKPLLEGVELTYKNFIDVLGKFQVEQVDPLGAPFDPQYHEAVTMVDNPNAEPNSVRHVMQKGYTLSGRLLRAAMVMVARGGAKKIDEKA